MHIFFFMQLALFLKKKFDRIWLELGIYDDCYTLILYWWGVYLTVALRSNFAEMFV